MIIRSKNPFMPETKKLSIMERLSGYSKNLHPKLLTKLAHIMSHSLVSLSNLCKSGQYFSANSSSVLMSTIFLSCDFRWYALLSEIQRNIQNAISSSLLPWNSALRYSSVSLECSGSKMLWHKKRLFNTSKSSSS